jgi:hypothetical protein
MFIVTGCMSECYADCGSARTFLAVVHRRWQAAQRPASQRHHGEKWRLQRPYLSFSIMTSAIRTHPATPSGISLGPSAPFCAWACATMFIPSAIALLSTSTGKEMRHLRSRKRERHTAKVLGTGMTLNSKLSTLSAHLTRILHGENLPLYSAAGML